MSTPVNPIFNYTGTHPQRMSLARGYAIDAFAHLEGALCDVLTAVGEMSSMAANAAFFSASTMRARLGMISDLMHLKFGKKYSAYWKSVKDRVGALTEVRNRIVHWRMTNTMDEQGNLSIILVSENAIKLSPYAKVVTEQDVIAFIEEVKFLSRALTRWRLSITHPQYFPPAEPDEFSKPLKYPEHQK